MSPGPAERENLLWCVGNLASLRYDQTTVERWLEKMAMIDTPLMQKLRAEGRAEGEARGKAKGEANALLKVLAARGFSISEPLRQQVLECQDLDILDRWLTTAVTAKTLEEVFR